jgi:CSLREA domain-containing protein
MRPLRRLSTLLACAAVTTLAWAAGASAATFTVTSQNDADDGICDGPHCSLREAINAANRTEAADLLRFSSDDPIVPATELPAIVSPLHITAFDTGRCDTDSAPLRLSGRGADFSGLVFAPGSDGSQICLVNVGGFRTGIELRSHGNAIRLSTIGTNPAGTSDAPNDVAGILVSGSGNLIGGERVRTATSSQATGSTASRWWRGPATRSRAT